MNVKSFSLLCLLLLACSGTSMAQSVAGPVVVPMDEGWRFHLGDIDPQTFRPNSDEAAGGSKGGGAWGAAAVGFDDTSWRTLDLPHDWVIEQPYRSDAVRSQGYRPRGIGWYRKKFQLKETDRGRHLRLQFDGIATHATVWVNGSLVARNWSGYTSFEADITSIVRYGAESNTIAVRVDAEAMEGWWYEGGGIYRHVRLVESAPVHVVTDGLYADPRKVGVDKWVIPVEVSLANAQATPSRPKVAVVLRDPTGRRITQGVASVNLDAWATATARVSLVVRNPQRWTLQNPRLYTVQAEISDAGRTDVATTRCGFRTFAFDAKKGFSLNGQPLKIKGVCGHQDHAGVGVAVPDPLWEFRLRKLKEMGANAYRTAHNPPSKEFLDACDRLGILVMDENRHFSTSKEVLDQLAWLVRRDRNHPSVILWSLFNEENLLQGTEQGMRMASQMKGLVKALDPTRPVTAAQNGGQLTGERRNPNNAANVLDVVGINYQVDKYSLIRRAYPEKPIISSEDTSQVMTRGAFETDWQKLILSSYDDKYPGWSDNHRTSWAAITAQPSFGATFVWTGFDYHGEPSPFGWPAANSYFGCLDLCGFPKTAYYIRQAQWITDRPIVALVPHWNWEGREGQSIRVMVVTNQPTASLRLNGRLLGTKPVDATHTVEWQVPYEAGRLEAEVSANGKVAAKTSVETTGPVVGLRLVTDRTAMMADGQDAVPVTVEAIDAQGRRVPTDDPLVTIEVSGGATLAGVGNGDPTSHDPETGPTLRLFNGLGQVILRSKRSGESKVRVTVSARSLSAGSAELLIRK